MDYLTDKLSDIDDETLKLTKGLRETTRDLEVTKRDYQETQRAVQLLQVIENYLIFLLLLEFTKKTFLRLNWITKRSRSAREASSWSAETSPRRK